MSDKNESYHPDLDDASFDEPLLHRDPNTDTGESMPTARSEYAAAAIGLSTAITSGVLAGNAVWEHAPTVGGDAAPVIRGIATVVGTFVGFEVGVLLGVFIVGVLATAVEVFNR